THAISEFSVPTNGLSYVTLGGITAGPDGNLWFTVTNANTVAEINPTTHAISEFSTSWPSGPLGITAGPDGNLWFTMNTANLIGEINPTTHDIAGFRSSNSGNPQPTWITVGPEGNLWF